MKKNVLNLEEQFCSEIEMAAVVGSEIFLQGIENKFQLYDNDQEKLKFIESERDKIREVIKDSPYIEWLSLEEITAGLTDRLGFFYRQEEMSNATSVEFSETLKEGEHVYDRVAKKLTVAYRSSNQGKLPDFSFAQLTYFHSLIYYVQCCMLFLEFKRLKAEFEEKKISSPQVLPPVEWLIPDKHRLLLALNQMKPTAKQTNDTPLRLSDVFESKSRYKKIMKILVEQNKCDPNTMVWTGSEKGDKSYLAALLKYLHSQGYYKDNKLTNAQIKEICMNTFRWEISIDCIKKAKPNNFDMKIIPLASTLPL